MTAKGKGIIFCIIIQRTVFNEQKYIVYEDIAEMYTIQPCWDVHYTALLRCTLYSLAEMYTIQPCWDVIIQSCWDVVIQPCWDVVIQSCWDVAVQPCWDVAM